jgi:hypothetical protein
MNGSCEGPAKRIERRLAVVPRAICTNISIMRNSSRRCPAHSDEPLAGPAGQGIAF